MRSQLPTNRDPQVQGPGAVPGGAPTSQGPIPAPSPVPSPAPSPAPAPAPAPGGGGSDMTALLQRLNKARADGTLGSLVGHEDAASYGDKDISGDYDSLGKIFGYSDIDALMGKGSTPAPGGASTPGVPAPVPPAPGAPAPAPAPAPVPTTPGAPAPIGGPAPAAMGGAGDVMADPMTGWNVTSAPGSLAGRLGARRAAGPFGSLIDVMRGGRVY